MIIQITYRELKMVVVVTTAAFAFGVGAFVACVVPWFYNKSGDDDDRGTRRFQNGGDCFSPSRYPVDEKKTSSKIKFQENCPRRFNFVRIIVPKSCVTWSMFGSSKSGESVKWESTSADCRQENLTIRETTFSIQGSYRSKNLDSANLGILKLEKTDIGSTDRRTTSAESRSTNFEKKLSVGDSNVTKIYESPEERTNVISIEGASDSPRKIDESVTRENLILQEDSKQTVTIAETSGSSIENKNSTYREISNENDSLNLIKPEKPILSTDFANDSNRTLRTTMPRSPACRDLTKFFGPPKILKLAIVDSSKMAELLEDIDGLSPNKEITEETEKKNESVGNGSTECSICKNHKEDKKFLRFSSGIKSFWRGIKNHKTSNSSINSDQSTRNFSKDLELPVGHSTLINVESMRSSIYRYNLSQRYNDPRIKEFHNYSSNDKINRLNTENNEEPLDLSIRKRTPREIINHEDSPEIFEDITSLLDLREENNERDSSLSDDTNSDKTTGGKKKVLQGLLDFLRIKKKSSSRKKGSMRSESIKYYSDRSSSFFKDENENIVSKNASDEGFSKKFKKVLNFRKKLNDNNSSLNRNDKNLSTVSDKFQRISSGTLSRLKKKIVTDNSLNPELQLNFSSSCNEMGFILANDDHYSGPCTEL